MNTAPPLDIKVVYAGSARGRSGRRRIGSSAPATNFIRLGVINLLVASALYYGTWWQADPELQVMLLMHTEFSGVDSDAVVKQLIPDRTEGSSGPNAAVAQAPVTLPMVQGLTSRGNLFLTTVHAWKILSTLSVCALALSGGTFLRRGGKSRVRTAGVILGPLVICALGWMIYSRWTTFGGYVPDELRFASAAIAIIAMLFGMLVGEKARRFANVAAILLILSAAGTAWGLHVAVQSSAIEPKYATVGALAVIFGLHSLWGWILLPLAARLPR